jgi:hypothetical protein
MQHPLPADYGTVPNALGVIRPVLFCTLNCLIDPPRAHRWQVSCAADGVGPVDVLRAHVAQDACGAVWESGVAPLASD